MSETTQAIAGAASHIEVTAADLPLACPMPRMTLRNMHPKVYLPIEVTGQATVPTAVPLHISRER